MIVRIQQLNDHGNIVWTGYGEEVPSVGHPLVIFRDGPLGAIYLRTSSVKRIEDAMPGLVVSTGEDDYFVTMLRAGVVVEA